MGSNILLKIAYYQAQARSCQALPVAIRFAQEDTDGPYHWNRKDSCKESHGDANHKSSAGYVIGSETPERVRRVLMALS